MEKILLEVIKEIDFLILKKDNYNNILFGSEITDNDHNRNN